MQQRSLSTTAELVLLGAQGMNDDVDDDPISVNCGRCGKPFTARIADIKDKRTIDCPDCEKSVPLREQGTRKDASD